MKARTRILTVVSLVTVLGLTGMSMPVESRSDEFGELQKAQSFLGMLDKYLTVMGKWSQMLSKRETTALLVAERVVDIYEQKGSKTAAIPELRKMLEKYRDNAPIRHMLHFKISEIYKDSGQPDKALEELRAIVAADR